MFGDERAGPEQPVSGGPRLGERLEAMAAGARALVEALEINTLTGAQAMALAEGFARVEKLCSTGKVLCARRVEQTQAYVASGHRDGAAWLAQVSGVSPGRAHSSLKSAARAESLPALDQARRSGELSESQCDVIALGAGDSPSWAQDLVALATGRGARGPGHGPGGGGGEGPGGAEPGPHGGPGPGGVLRGPRGLRRRRPGGPHHRARPRPRSGWPQPGWPPPRWPQSRHHR